MFLKTIFECVLRWTNIINTSIVVVIFDITIINDAIRETISI